MNRNREIVRVANPACDHGKWWSCTTYLEKMANGSWMAKCSDNACVSIAGESVWRAGGNSSPFTYEELEAMARAHCLKRHSR
jgi:hypothetical protein